ncbi:MAG: hypothetical protein ACLUHE_15445 [Christensenellales bacterium]
MNSANRFRPYTLLLAPLTDGQHFVWNLGAWFIIPLFFAQVFYAGIRRLSVRWHENEVMTFLLCLIPGCAAVQLCFSGRQEALPLFLLRPMILLPGFAGGQLYRRVLEKRDRLPTVPYLLAIVVLRVLLSTRYENLAYLLSDCSYFVSRRIRRIRPAARWPLRFICALPACLRRISAEAASHWPSAEIRSPL